MNFSNSEPKQDLEVQSSTKMDCPSPVPDQDVNAAEEELGVKRKGVKEVQDDFKRVKGNGIEIEDPETATLDSNNQTPYDWEEEHKHYQKIMLAYENYRNYYTKKLNKQVKYVQSLPSHHQSLLENYSLHLEEIRKCFIINQELLSSICPKDSNIFINHNVNNGSSGSQSIPQPTPADYDKLQSVLKQIVRDWSREGERERDSCYGPIIEEVERKFSVLKAQGNDIRVLVPGAGLCRLAFEIVRRGYIVEGNEFSMFMLFASNFILNKVRGTLTHSCYPFVHQSTNNSRREDQIRLIRFPDQDPSDLPCNTRFSMTAGDFLDVYGNEENRGAWDCVVTCFFIDCSKNIVDSIERIHHCLKDGGYWISLGPLLYHYADAPDEDSIEPSLDILRDIIQRIGFLIEKEQMIESQYCENKESMLKYGYESVYFVCKKV